LSKTRELVEVLRSHIGKLELRGETVMMCMGSVKDGLHWETVLTSEQLWSAIDRAKGIFVE
jgi:hypothetical protein